MAEAPQAARRPPVIYALARGISPGAKPPEPPRPEAPQAARRPPVIYALARGISPGAEPPEPPRPEAPQAARRPPVIYALARGISPGGRAPRNPRDPRLPSAVRASEFPVSIAFRPSHWHGWVAWQQAFGQLPGCRYALPQAR